MMYMNSEDEYNKQYPEADFTKTVHKFTPEELSELNSLVTIVKMGQLANIMANNFVTGQVVTRLGTKQSADTGVLYDTSKNQVITYEPKLWCSRCDKRKAEFKMGEKIFCQDCIEEVKNEQVKKVEPEKKSKKN